MAKEVTSSTAGAVGELPLDDPALADAWLRSFEASSRLKGLSDTVKTHQVTDLFLTQAGLPAIGWLAELVRPWDLDSMPFGNIKRLAVRGLVEKQLELVRRRASFVSLRQEPTESCQGFAARLAESAGQCQLDRLMKQPPSELMLAVLIGGLRRAEDRERLLERLKQAGRPLTLASCQGFLSDSPEPEAGVDGDSEPDLEPVGVMTPAEFAQTWRPDSRCLDLEHVSVTSNVNELEQAEVTAGDEATRADADNDEEEEDAEATGQTASTEAVENRQPSAVGEPPAAPAGGQKRPYKIVESVRKEFHVHVLSHEDSDICVEADTIEELEDMVNNLVQRLDDVHLTLNRKQKPMQRAGPYWSPMMAVKTQFRVCDF